MKGALIFNKYYSDSGLDYIKSRLCAEFSSRGVALDEVMLYAADGLEDTVFPYDFALFFDKDLALARRLENSGVRIFNSARTLELCDDKEKTFSVIKASGGFRLPATVFSPLMYDISDNEDEKFLRYVESKVGYPAVIKERIGSQGRQVYLAQNFEELKSFNSRLKHIPHLYQRFVGSEIGSDIRVYVIGKKAVAAVKRKNTTDFRSNVFLGGETEIHEISTNLKKAVQSIANTLNLEYGSVDFIKSENEYYFIESNSNVYLRAIEDLGVSIASRYADYVMRELR